MCGSDEIYNIVGVCVCDSVHMHVSAFVHARACVPLGVPANGRACACEHMKHFVMMSTCMRRRMHILNYLCVCACDCVFTYTCMCTCTCTWGKRCGQSRVAEKKSGILCALI